MVLAVASGKGGTGKTTLAVNMASVSGSAIQLLDCDVEEPNAHLFLPGTAIRKETVAIPVPEVDGSKCDGCGECGRFCRFNAIVSYGAEALVFPDMCHGCGGCVRVCPRKAIREIDHPIGTVETSRAGNIRLAQGRLRVGAPMAPPLIRAVKARLEAGLPAILDAPPGTACPVVATIRGADAVLLVTEPTPFGLHDLSLAVEMITDLGVPFGVVINRTGSGDDRVHRFCAERGIPVLGEIPDDRRIAEAVSRGRLVVEALPAYAGVFRDILDRSLGLGKNVREASHAHV